MATMEDVGEVAAKRAGRLFVWRGIAALILAVLLVVMPRVSLFLVVTLFGAYALVDGIVAFAEGIRLRRVKARSWPSFVEGVVGVALAALAWSRPGGVLLIAVLAIAARTLVVGVLELGAAIVRHRELAHPVWLGIAGVASLVFGIVLAANPSLGVLTLLWICAAYSFVFGIAFISVGVSLRRGARLRTAATTATAVLMALGAGGAVARAADDPGSVGLPAPSDDAGAPPPERAVPSPETSQFNSLEEKDRRARERAEDELLRFRHPVAGHEFSPEQPSTTEQPGMPAPRP